jgi:hypothetical protein
MHRNFPTIIEEKPTMPTTSPETVLIASNSRRHGDLADADAAAASAEIERMQIALDAPPSSEVSRHRRERVARATTARQASGHHLPAVVETLLNVAAAEPHDPDPFHSMKNLTMDRLLGVIDWNVVDFGAAKSALALVLASAPPSESDDLCAKATELLYEHNQMMAEFAAEDAAEAELTDAERAELGAAHRAEQERERARKHRVDMELMKFGIPQDRSPRAKHPDRDMAEQLVDLMYLGMIMACGGQLEAVVTEVRGMFRHGMYQDKLIISPEIDCPDYDCLENMAAARRRILALRDTLLTMLRAEVKP